jgi:hypothetical protein
MPADGDGLHALDETQQHRRGDGYGVVDPGSGACEVTVNSGVLAQSDTLTVASGDVLVGGTTVSLATQTLSLDAASATNPRRDVVYVDAAGAVQVAKGTAEAVEPEGQSLTRFGFYRPAPPDLASTDGTVLAEVWIPTGASSIQSADIRDRRLRALGPHSLDEDIATQSELDTHAGDADAHHAKDHDHTEAGISAVPTGGLVADTVTVAGNAVTLGGSTAIAHANLSSIGTDDHHAQDHNHTTASVSTVPNNGLTNDSVSVAAGDGLKNGGSVSLGGSVTIDVEPADFAGAFLSDDGSDALQVDTDGTIEGDGSGNARVRERFSYDPGVTQLEDGQTDTELNRIVLQSGETLTIERIELRGQGGGSSTSVDIEVYDVTASSSIGAQTLGGTSKNPGSSGAGNTVIIRYTNSSGSQSDAAPRVTGYIEGA